MQREQAKDTSYDFDCTEDMQPTNQIQDRNRNLIKPSREDGSENRHELKKNHNRLPTSLYMPFSSPERPKAEKRTALDHFDKLSYKRLRAKAGQGNGQCPTPDNGQRPGGFQPCAASTPKRLVRENSPRAIDYDRRPQQPTGMMAPFYDNFGNLKFPNQPVTPIMNALSFEDMAPAQQYIGSSAQSCGRQQGLFPAQESESMSFSQNDTTNRGAMRLGDFLRTQMPSSGPPILLSQSTHSSQRNRSCLRNPSPPSSGIAEVPIECVAPVSGPAAPVRAQSSHSPSRSLCQGPNPTARVQRTQPVQRSMYNEGVGSACGQCVPILTDAAEPSMQAPCTIPPRSSHRINTVGRSHNGLSPIAVNQLRNPCPPNPQGERAVSQSQQNAMRSAELNRNRNFSPSQSQSNQRDGIFNPRNQIRSDQINEIGGIGSHSIRTTPTDQPGLCHNQEVPELDGRDPCDFSSFQQRINEQLCSTGIDTRVAGMVASNIAQRLDTLQSSTYHAPGLQSQLNGTYMQANGEELDNGEANEDEQQLRLESLIKDNYSPGLIQETLDGNENFNTVAFDLAFGERGSVPHNAPEIEPLTLLEAFIRRIDYERDSFRREEMQRQEQSAAGIASQGNSSRNIVTEETGGSSTHSNAALANAANLDAIIKNVDRYFSTKHTTNVNKAISCFLKAEKMHLASDSSKSLEPNFEMTVRKIQQPITGCTTLNAIIYSGRTVLKK